MTQLLKAALICTIVGAICIVLELALTVETGLAGLFIMGMAGGLVVGHEMSKPAKPATTATA